MNTPSVAKKRKSTRFLYHGKLLALFRPDRTIAVHRWRLIVHITVRRDYGHKITQRTYQRLAGSASYKRVRAVFGRSEYTQLGAVTVLHSACQFRDGFGTVYEDGRSRGDVRSLIDACGVGLSISQI